MLAGLTTNELSTFDSFYFPLLPIKNIKKIKKFKRVLIIDNDFKMSNLLKSILQNNKEFKITIANDPYEAIDLMTGQVFDLIVIEWNLPMLNGLETLMEVEKGFKFEPNLPLEWDNKKVPVIILSDSDKSSCKPPYTKHFKYFGYINKGIAIEHIIEHLMFHFERSA
jgi:PleD family two-component response regulator